MFNESWIRFAVLMIVFGVALHSNALVVLAALLLTVIPVAWAWNRVALWRVSYDRTLSEHRVFVGEQVDLGVRVGNRKILPLAWIKIDDQFPAALKPANKPLAPSHIPLTGYLSQHAALGAFEGARWQYQVPCNQRGYFILGPARLRSGDLFGLFEREWVSPRTDRLIVYPQIRPMEDWGLPPKDPLGENKSRVPLFYDATRPRGVRDYRPDDAPKHIHWRMTARTGALQVKLYDPTITYQWVLFVNVATFAQAWQGVNSALLERVISLAASIANFAAEHKYAVGMIANGTWPESDQRLKILPSRDPNHLRHILEALAAVTSFVTTPIEVLLANESTKIAWGATLVMITGVVTDEMLAEMLRLRQAGRRIAFISLDEDWTPTEELEGIVVRQVSGHMSQVTSTTSQVTGNHAEGLT
ncbi:MAG: DUF58 domain-containing protein [Chloroflexi bacterium]|nr:DUF58 domain-containing protein [Chloroflexota bacterium]